MNRSYNSASDPFGPLGIEDDLLSLVETPATLLFVANVRKWLNGHEVPPPCSEVVDATISHAKFSNGGARPETSRRTNTLHHKSALPFETTPTADTHRSCESCSQHNFSLVNHRWSKDSLFICPRRHRLDRLHPLVSDPTVPCRDNVKSPSEVARSWAPRPSEAVFYRTCNQAGRIKPGGTSP
jgi:hypothetical protein